MSQSLPRSQTNFKLIKVVPGSLELREEIFSGGNGRYAFLFADLALDENRIGVRIELGWDGSLTTKWSSVGSSVNIGTSGQEKWVDFNDAWSDIKEGSKKWYVGREGSAWELMPWNKDWQNGDEDEVSKRYLWELLDGFENWLESQNWIREAKIIAQARLLKYQEEQVAKTRTNFAESLGRESAALLLGAKDRETREWGIKYLGQSKTFKR